MDKYSWIAGWLEGEGWFGNKGRSVQIEASSTDKDIIDRIHSLFGGHVYEVKKSQDHHKQAWIWTLNSWPAAELMCQIIDMMGERRRQDISRVLEVFWTSKIVQTSIVCRHGHYVLGENRVRKSNGYYQCKQCLRQYNRDSRARRSLL